MKVVEGNDSWPTSFNPLLGPEKPEELLSLWRDIRERLLRWLGAMVPSDRLPRYGPSMSARSFATARLMETWAHAQDVFDRLRARRISSNRLRHIADTCLKWLGDHAAKWLTIAQAFAGVAQSRPSPGERVVEYIK